MQGCFYFIENRLIILWWHMDCPNHWNTQSFLMAQLKLLAQIQVRKTSYKNILVFLSKAGLLVFYYFFDVFKEVIFEAAVKKWNKKKRPWFLSMLQKVFSYQRTTFANHLYGEGCQGQGYLESWEQATELILTLLPSSFLFIHSW